MVAINTKSLDTTLLRFVNNLVNKPVERKVVVPVAGNVMTEYTNWNDKSELCKELELVDHGLGAVYRSYGSK